MQRIVITGASSFIGQALIREAVAEDIMVTAIVRHNCKKKDELKKLDNVSIVEMNMDEYYKLGEIVTDTDCFVHLAWNGTRGKDRMNYEMQQQNYECSMAAIKSVVEAGCKRVVIAGSQAEYGPCNDIITENTVCKPNTEYGTFKLKLYKDAYKLCSEKDVSFKEPRFFSLYGNGDFEATLIMSLMKNLKSDSKCELTACTQMWDFCYIVDAVKAVLCLCELDCQDGAYNIGSGDIRILKDYVDEMKKTLNSKSEIVFGAVAYPPTGPVSIQPSIEKITEQTGWKPMTKFKDGINAIMMSVE